MKDAGRIVEHYNYKIFRESKDIGVEILTIPQLFLATCLRRLMHRPQLELLGRLPKCHLIDQLN